MKAILSKVAFNTAIHWAYNERVEPLQSHWEDLGGFDYITVEEAIENLKADLDARKFGPFPNPELQASSLALSAKRLVGALIETDFSETHLVPRSCRSQASWEAITLVLRDALLVVRNRQIDAPSKSETRTPQFTYLAGIIASRLSAVHIIRNQGLLGMDQLPKFPGWHPDLKWALESAKTTETKFVEINREFMSYLAKHPDWMQQVTPRRFEEIIAELLRDMGCEVELTQQTRDGGRDIFAAFQTPFGRMLGIVECKRYKPDARLGIDLLRNFLWVLEREDRANFGLIATTATFSSEAWKLQTHEQWRLKLKEFEHIKEWLKQYGKWAESDTSGLWLPKTSFIGVESL